MACLATWQVAPHSPRPPPRIGTPCIAGPLKNRTLLRPLLPPAQFAKDEPAEDGCQQQPDWDVDERALGKMKQRPGAQTGRVNHVGKNNVGRRTVPNSFVVLSQSGGLVAQNHVALIN